MDELSLSWLLLRPYALLERVDRGRVLLRIGLLLVVVLSTVRLLICMRRRLWHLHLYLRGRVRQLEPARTTRDTGDGAFGALTATCRRRRPVVLLLLVGRHLKLSVLLAHWRAIAAAIATVIALRPVVVRRIAVSPAATAVRPAGVLELMRLMPLVLQVSCCRVVCIVLRLLRLLQVTGRLVSRLYLRHLHLCRLDAVELRIGALLLIGRHRAVRQVRQVAPVLLAAWVRRIG